MGGWRGFHPGDPTVPHWRPDVLVYTNHPSSYGVAWHAGRTDCPPEENPGLPGQKRALASSVSSCGFEVVYERVGSYGRIAWCSEVCAGG